METELKCRVCNTKVIDKVGTDTICINCNREYHRNYYKNYYQLNKVKINQKLKLISTGVSVKKGITIKLKCSKCQIEKFPSKFGTNSLICKMCTEHPMCTICGINPPNYQGKKRRKRTPCKSCSTRNLPFNWRKITSRKYQLKVKYNITPEQYEEMKILQQNRCAICNTIPKKLVIDHNHKTGKVRQLLCNHCNSALGMLKEDINVLNSVINYIKRHND